MKLALVSPPFSDASWPSIQLAVLEAYVQRHRPDDRVTLVHHSLEVAAAVGPTRYDLLAWRPFAAEAVYAALRFDSMAQSALGLLESELASGGDPVPDRAALVQQLVMPARQATERLARRLTADRHDVIGISVCLAQLIPSLYLAKRLRALGASAKIVLGGSAVGSVVGERILGVFDEIDYVVDGEGERPLVALLNHLEQDSGAEPAAVPGLVYRRPDGSVQRNPVDQIRELSELPPIGYTSYFEERARLEPGLPALRPPTLLVETSRGCWWDRTKKRPDQICAFCNLNVQWEGYREKPNERVIAEVEALTREHRCLELGFVDNILRYKGGKALFDGLAALGRDLSISYELRAS
ncbi:MAG: cobalamin-dependent protein, partial [Planctomycetota bacterium]